ncbi:hypothetical protein [Atopomonas sediminilitoris]|uniref:hypothetical protein n=1 Tax=Atopomonas sediminilitoris TaxID=2919919 RepID=UPI001F4EB3F0|nr:hypothetical protein [Atopomonas sediminilitoris]MCJ8169057.1 hypothetical protein [Atopomonas sediminilitoris]
MRQILLCTTLAVFASTALAETEPTQSIEQNEPAALGQQVQQLQETIGTLQEQLAASEQERSALQSQVSTQAGVPSAEFDAVQQQLKRVQHDNQRLRQRLNEQENQPPHNGLLNTQQTWYALGALTVVLSLLLGVMLRSGGNKASKGAWLN